MATPAVVLPGCWGETRLAPAARADRKSVEVGDQVGKGGDAVEGGDGRGAAGREAGRAAGHRQRHLVGAVVAGEVAEAVEDLDGDRRADGDAGRRLARLLEEDQAGARRRH